MRHNDYSSRIPEQIFVYDEYHRPDESTLPDPQVNPVLIGARVPIQKVGIAPVDLPIKVWRREGGQQELQAQASLYCSLDDPNIKGLNLSRLYLVMHETIKDHLSLDGIMAALKHMAYKQRSHNAYCKLRFKYPWTQKSLRSNLEGHIAYNVELEGQYYNDTFRFYLTVDYIYSSTCPCSYELAHQATSTRGVAANAHSQRSIAKVKIRFDRQNIVWIEDIVELCREVIPPEVQVVVKRIDEQAFSELNGANLLFSEDAARLLYGALDTWYEIGKIFDFSIVIEHYESLHPWSAICVIHKGIQNGLR